MLSRTVDGMFKVKSKTRLNAYIFGLNLLSGLGVLKPRLLSDLPHYIRERLAACCASRPLV